MPEFDPSPKANSDFTLDLTGPALSSLPPDFADFAPEIVRECLDIIKGEQDLSQIHLLCSHLNTSERFLPVFEAVRILTEQLIGDRVPLPQVVTMLSRLAKISPAAKLHPEVKDELLSLALEYAGRIGEKTLVAWAALELGELRLEIQAYAPAVELLQYGLQAYEAIFPNHPDLIHYGSLLARAAKESHQTDVARETCQVLRTSCKQANELSDAIINAYLLIGEVYAESFLLEEALETYSELLDRLPAEENNYRGMALLGRGEVRGRNGEYQLAKDDLENAEWLLRPGQDEMASGHYIDSLQELRDIYRAQGELMKAEQIESKLRGLLPW